MVHYRELMAGGMLSLLVACGGNEQGTEQKVEKQATAGEEKEQAFRYRYDPQSTLLTWTAFKLSEKIGIDGTFEEIKVTTKESKDMFDVFTGATFEIPVASLNTQDQVRDGKIKRSFFGNLKDTEQLTGTIHSVDAKKASITINMNGKAVDYEGKIRVKDETITLKTTIDMDDFDGQVAMDSLGVVCEAKHTGPDGVNKLWSDINIAIQTTLAKVQP